MSLPRELDPDELYRESDSRAFAFETTDDIDDGVEIVGQSRAVEAVRFAVGMAHDGYNLFAMGPPGTGKRFMIEHFLKRESQQRGVPPDLCYVNNFEDTNRPRLLSLPPGVGRRLKKDIEHMVEEIVTTLPAAFESEEYQARLQAAHQELKEQHERRLEELQKNAQSKGYSMMQTPMGVVFAPMKDGEVLSPEEFQKVPEDERSRMDSEVATFQEELQAILRTVPRLERELRARLRELNQELTEFALGHVIDEMRERYAEYPAVVDYMEGVRHDLVHHAREFIQPADAGPGGHGSSDPGPGVEQRYKVNVVVDNAETECAPVVYEDHPVYENLVGRIEHVSQMGTLITDFSLIRPGALHRANGGYLILDVRRVLMQPYAWEGLKRVLKAREIRIESASQAMGLISTVSLEPEPAPLDVKVVLIGDPMLYYLLTEHDPDFSGLFKVAADFDDRVSRDPESENLYARLMTEMIRRHELKRFDRSAVGRIIEDAARRAADADRLSGHIGHLADLVRECDYWATEDNASTVSSSHVETALAAREYRSDRVRVRMEESVLRETIHIATDGAAVGQINGLAVLQLGGYAFGRPSRITARIRLGRGEVVDIEREVELSGPIHSKGVLILASFLGARYASDRPLSLAASLVFEQSYSGVDGDSASSTELYALLSAISGLPIRQSLAVTGSVNQHGQVQAIGGANEKIEGFFDLCKARELTGDQGVMIPASNIKHLMLRKDVVAAVRDGKFHIYAVETIDQGIELLTGVRAGEPDAEGEYTPDSVNGRVARRLAELTEARLSFSRAAGESRP
jgi:lon-related putative ATP-dependent protease